MKTSELRELVRGHFGLQGRGWAVFDEVRSETGYTAGQPVRTCDVLALSLWRSEGIELHGLELKVSRGDWLRELRQPGKAGAIAKVRRLLVGRRPEPRRRDARRAADGLGADGGRPRAGRRRALVGPWLRPFHKAPKRTAEPLDRTFVAALVRKVARREFTVSASEVA